MFSEPKGKLNNSKSVFSEKIDDTFGNSIVQEAYEPFDREIQQLSFAWDESEMRKAEITALLIELRMIL